MFTSAPTQNLDKPSDRNILRSSSTHNTTNSVRSNRKGAAKSPMSDKDLVDAILYCYKTIRAKRNTNRQSPYDIRKQVKQAWQQKYPQSSISLRNIDKIIKSHQHHTTPPTIQSQHTPDSSSHSNTIPTHENGPDHPLQLLDMRSASVHLASQPIFKYICYNCGRLLTDEPKRSELIVFDPQTFHLSHPPVLDLFDTLGHLSYTNSTGTWISCTKCKNGPVDLYTTCDPNTGELYVPQALADLASPYEKRQIALAGLISKIVKPRSDKFKIWEHIRGKLDYHYFGMYGFMVANDQKPDGETPSKVQLRIQRALFWLRTHNPLYTTFYSNYDTLYRFDPDKVRHLHKATDFRASNHTTIKTHLRDEDNAIVTTLDDSGIPPCLHATIDVAGVQHPKIN